jgi:SAM-dependent methyltransferase
MNYIKALKIYNDRKGEKNEWCVYKKGTPEYLEVMKIMKDYKEKLLSSTPEGKDNEDIAKKQQEIKSSNIISNTIKIKKAKKQLEELRQKKAEEEKINMDNIISLFKIIENSFEIIQSRFMGFRYNMLEKMDTIKSKEKVIIANPRLKKIEREMIDMFNDFIKNRDEINNNIEIISNSTNEYYNKYTIRFNYLYSYIFRTYEDIIDDLFSIKKEYKRNQVKDYNDEFIEYIYKIGDIREKYPNSIPYFALEEKRVVPITISLVFKEINLLLKNYLNQDKYYYIEDYYNNNKSIYIDIELYNKFIKAFNLKYTNDDFIYKLKFKFSYNKINNFKLEGEIIKEKKLKEKLEELKAKKAEIELSSTPEGKKNEDIAKEKEKKLKEKLEELKAKKAEIELSSTPEGKKNPDLNKIIEIPERSKRVSTNEYIEIKENIDKDTEKYLPVYLPLFNINDLLGLFGFSREDIKKLNIFLTPMTNAEELIDYSFIYNQYKQDKIYYPNKKIVYDILEPTSGIGNLIESLVEGTENPEIFRIDAVEISRTLYEIGKARFKNFNNINWYNQNFFDFKPNKKYDYIFMNPPFNINIKNKKIYDIDFINECYKLLKEDGKLCAIISNVYINSKEPKFKKFKEFVENNAEQYEVNMGFKKDKTTMKEMQTNVKMMIVIINKNEEEKSIF